MRWPRTLTAHSAVRTGREYVPVRDTNSASRWFGRVDGPICSRWRRERVWGKRPSARSLRASIWVSEYWRIRAWKI